MRVLVVTNMYPADGRPGFGVFVREQVEAQRRIPGLTVEVWPFAGGGLRYLTAAARLRSHLRHNRYDVIHAHYGLSGMTAALATRRMPMLVTFHGTDVHHPVVGRLSKRLAKRTEVAAAVSPELRKALAGGLGGQTPVFVLPTGVNLERFKPISRVVARRHLGLAPDGRYLLFPADPERAMKRYDLAKELATRLGEVELLVMRGVTPADVPFWINAADVVLVTSDYEGFGLAICEALACDVPVLSTPVGIAPLVLGGLEGAHCGRFDAESWAAAAEPQLRRADPRVDGRSRARLFDRNLMAERVFCVYREMLAAEPKTYRDTP